MIQIAFGEKGGTVIRPFTGIRSRLAKRKQERAVWQDK